jgi:(2R)-sulfolactate sulfo-lyase subunit alpha
MKHKFLSHAPHDNVGVAVEDIKAGEEVLGVMLDNNQETVLISNNDIPLGHKIALQLIKKGDFVFEYGEKIGVATDDINKGDWVHIHNIKSARW